MSCYRIVKVALSNSKPSITPKPFPAEMVARSAARPRRASIVRASPSSAETPVVPSDESPTGNEDTGGSTTVNKNVNEQLQLVPDGVTAQAEILNVEPSASAFRVQSIRSIAMVNIAVGPSTGNQTSEDGTSSAVDPQTSFSLNTIISTIATPVATAITTPEPIPRSLTRSRVTYSEQLVNARACIVKFHLTLDPNCGYLYRARQCRSGCTEWIFTVYEEFKPGSIRRIHERSFGIPEWYVGKFWNKEEISNGRATWLCVFPDPVWENFPVHVLESHF